MRGHFVVSPQVSGEIDIVKYRTERIKMLRILIAVVFLVAFAATSQAYSYVGCYEDRSTRILEGQFTNGDMTIEKCVQTCTYRGDYYAGVEYANQCFCGKHLKQYPKLSDSACSTNCGGNSNQKCGGTWKISVYATDASYLGCYLDKSDRILEGPSTSSNQMTSEYCKNYCRNAGKAFALTQYASQCFCGNHLKNYQKKPDSECSYDCSKGNGEKCGGFWRGSLYTVL